MDFEQTLEFLGKVSMGFYGINPFGNTCSKLIKGGMPENEVKYLAYKQGIDFDEELPDQFNRNNLE